MKLILIIRLILVAATQDAARFCWLNFDTPTAYSGVRVFKQWNVSKYNYNANYKILTCELGVITSVTNFDNNLFNSAICNRSECWHFARRRQYVSNNWWVGSDAMIGGAYSNQTGEWAPFLPIVNDWKEKWITEWHLANFLVSIPLLRTPHPADVAYPRSDNWARYVAFDELY